MSEHQSIKAFLKSADIDAVSGMTGIARQSLWLMANGLKQLSDQDAADILEVMEALDD